MPLLYAFSTPALTQAFISLPLEDRISDGFHRRFLARHAPALMIEAARTQRRHVPRTLRRLASARRDRRGFEDAAAVPATVEMLHDRPRTRAYVVEDVLGRDLLADAMGRGWLDAVRTGFLAGRPHAVETAFRATSVAALDTALAQLNAAGRSHA